MKKIVILLAAFALTARVATAQTEVANPVHTDVVDRTPEQQANLMARRLTKELALTADQTEKVRQIGLARANELQAIRGKYAGNRQGMGQEMRALRDKYDVQLKAVLTADQYRQYDQLRDDQLEKHREKRKDGSRQPKS